MGLAESLEANKQSLRRGPKCTICIMVMHLDKKDRQVLESAMADDTFTSMMIIRALEAEGHKISRSAFARHRRQECAGYGAG